MAAINERRKEFNQNNNQAMQGNQRYHADEVEERFAKYKAGAMRYSLYSVHKTSSIEPSKCLYQIEVSRHYSVWSTLCLITVRSC